MTAHSAPRFAGSAKHPLPPCPAWLFVCLCVCFCCLIVCFTTLGRQVGRLGREETRIKMAERRKKRQQLIDDHATAAVQHGSDGDPIATPIEWEREREGVCERASATAAERGPPRCSRPCMTDGWETPRCPPRGSWNLTARTNLPGFWWN